MNKKISLGLTLSIALIACAVTFVLTDTFSLRAYNKQIADVSAREEMYSGLQELDSVIRSNYAGTIDNDKLLESIERGYVSGIGDPNAAFFTANEYSVERQRQNGLVITSGIAAVADESGYIRADEVFDNSAAKSAGIIVGDIITEVDDVSVLQSGVETAIAKLAGEEGTRVVVTIQRDGVPQKKTLIRQQVELKAVRGSVVNKVGYIQINAFSNVSSGQFADVLSRMELRKVTGLVIDLRGTGGSNVAPLREMAARLLPEAKAAVFVKADGAEETLIETNGSEQTQLPIAVLVSGGTERLGELFAAMLKDSAGATIVGTATKGSDVLPVFHVFRDGNAVRYSGGRVKSTGATKFGGGSGIIPDFTVQADISAGIETTDVSGTADIQLRKALEVIATQAK
ncbi:MAG: PDZ domain-containing protein [Oscillospiraceae bacterium]|jgi:carboxyl-terminal processing protease|nr:PDZ domain-containing protein [Oscillospiraceae bacterium]